MTKLSELMDFNKTVYALPQVHGRLNFKLKDPQTSNQEIADLIEKDPAICLVVLKLVNSALYGFAGRVSSIQQAVTLIGRNELAVLLLSSGAVKLFQKLPIDENKLYRHWQHSLLCALVAKNLSLFSPLSSQSASLFAAGLLHDIGKPVIWHQFPEQSTSFDETQGPYALLEQENSQLGFNHAQVGHELMKAWGLPAPLLTTTLWHHTPDKADQYRDWCVIIHLANRLAHLDSLECAVDALISESDANIQAFDESMMNRALEDAKELFVDMSRLFLPA